MTPKQCMMTKDLLYAERDMENPSFEWNGQDYPCIASPVTARLVLEEGGYEMANTVTMTVRIFNGDGSFVFQDNIIPAPQNDIQFLNLKFRIDQVNPNSIGACFEIVAYGPYRGV
jgi:hypothetical protein